MIRAAVFSCSLAALLHGATPALGELTATARETEANVVAEISFTAKNTHDDAFNTVTLDVVFTGPNGNQLKVPAFWAGDDTWTVRYASPVVGQHRFRSECSDTNDHGLHGVTGEVAIKPYAGTNPLYKHGPIRVASDRRHFGHADGTPLFWLADTWWMGLCHRLHWPDEFKTLAADRKSKGFNVVQIVAGLYPDMHPFDPRGANEAGYPWEMDYARIQTEYFDAADKRLQYLVDEGFSPCIVGAWGFFMPWMGVEKAKQHWRYLIARYGAMPVTWCAAGEANLPWYLAKGFPYDDRQQVSQWTEVMRYIRATDPFHRPLTIHPTGIGRLSARHATDDTSLLNFDMLQTPHGERAAVEPTIRTVRESYTDKPTMPVIDGEAAYEMLGDTLRTEYTRQMFWLSLMHGAAGHTYGANGIWQCNRPGEPYGPSPHHNGGVGYGKIPWNEAMNLPGSRQVGLGKKLFAQYEWHTFEPHPEWVQLASASQWEPIWGNWIWHAEGDPTKDAPVGKRLFRYTFNVSDVFEATLWLAVDDKFVVYLNGQRIGAGTGWQAAEPIDLLPGSGIRDGKNVLAVEAENLPGPVNANPAGLIASLLMLTNVGEIYENIQSNASWRSAMANDVKSNDWTSIDYNDSQWSAVRVLGSQIQAPWGKPTVPKDYGPFAIGIPRQVRMFYSLPRTSKSTLPRGLFVRALEPDVKYRARTFNPATGETADLPPLRTFGPKNDAAQVMNPTAGSDDDWVLILEKEK